VQYKEEDSFPLFLVPSASCARYIERRVVAAFETLTLFFSGFVVLGLIGRTFAM